MKRTPPPPAARMAAILAVLAAALIPVPRAGTALLAQAPLDTLRTRAERTDYVETTRYAEAVAYLEAVAAASPRAHLIPMGYTHEGRAIPLLVVGDVPDASPAAVHASDRLRVYLQGNIHGGEVPGKEALLALVRDLLSEPEPRWLDRLVLLVAPIYNADGNERVALTNRPRQNGPIGGMGQRPNAQGLDLNRDHMKLDSPEARSLAAMLTAYDPQVSVDLHTTNGTRHAYHLTYSPPLHPGTAEEIVALLRGEALPAITERIRERDGWHFYYYGNAFARDGEQGWYTFDHRPRFNSNYLGLRNRVAILSEAYAYATFRDRVAATRRFVEEILDWAAGSPDRIRAAIAAAEAPVVGRELPVRATFQGTDAPVEILMGAVEELRHPYTGETILNRLPVVEPTLMREFGTFRGTDFETVPARYLLLPGAEAAEDRLRAHGVPLAPLGEAGPLTVEVFRVDSTTVAERPFQGRRERTVHGGWVEATRTFPPGTLTVDVSHPLGRLAFYLLEPRSDDGLANWALLDEALDGGEYPIVRIR
ncbi:MAG: M14 family metallopeptidase [Longimicrobiales bacterium]|nr:M14 family metallopeptidase [Longimicrobiales bacterium]